VGQGTEHTTPFLEDRRPQGGAGLRASLRVAGQGPLPRAASTAASRRCADVFPSQHGDLTATISHGKVSSDVPIGASLGSRPMLLLRTKRPPQRAGLAAYPPDLKTAATEVIPFSTRNCDAARSG
jgi:hypothetical protein